MKFLSFSAYTFTTNKYYISHLPLQLNMTKWLNSDQRNMSKSMQLLRHILKEQGFALFFPFPKS